MDWPGNSQPGPRAGRGPPDPGGRRDPDRGLPERVKRMVGKVLTGNGITHYERGTYDPVGGVAEGFCAAVELSDAVTWPKASVAEPLRDQLLQLCRQRHDAFRMQRGEEVGCLLTQKPAASGTGAATAPRSAARPSTRCSSGPRAAANAAEQPIAWQTPHQRALEVDHIMPRNHGGSDDLSNLQALCFRCNAGKRWEARANPQHGERIAERMVGAAGHVRNSMFGSGQRTNRDEILITNRSEAAA
jgi:hypothetical protein